jgi:hypothetical protein
MIRESQADKRTKRAPLSRRIYISSNAFIVMLIILVVIVSMLYLVEFNKISTMGIIIDDLKDVRDDYIIENEVWNMRIANLKSLDVIQNQDVIRRMVDIDEVEFIEDSGINTENRN